MAVIIGSTPIAGIPSELSDKAPVVSPIFTGEVTAPSFEGKLTGNALSAVVAKAIPTSDIGGNVKIANSITPVPVDLTTTASSVAGCIGNSATCTKLATARKITVLGDATGEVTLDGSANSTLTLDSINTTNSDYYQFIKDPVLTTLWSTNIPTGTATLSQPYTNFKGIVVVSGGNDNSCVQAHIIWAWELDLRRSIATTLGSTWLLFGGASTIYWGCTNTSTTSTFTSQGENGRLMYIYGIN